MSLGRKTKHAFLISHHNSIARTLPPPPEPGKGTQLSGYLDFSPTRPALVLWPPYGLKPLSLRSFVTAAIRDLLRDGALLCYHVSLNPQDRSAPMTFFLK